MPLYPEVTIRKHEDLPTILLIRYEQEIKPRVVAIHGTRSVLSTDLCVKFLSDAYGEDIHREIWPIVKGGLS